MSHEHHHSHSVRIETLNGIFIFSIILNAGFVIVEIVAGIAGNSLGLLSDAGHNLGDVFSLMLAMLAFKLSGVPSNSRYTYGYKKSTVLVSLLNAIILLVAVGVIIAESIRKFMTPEIIDGNIVIWTAFAGIIVNGITAWMLMKKQHNDLNVRGAFLHMAADTLVSVGVVVSGLIIKYTGLMIVDPVVGIIISLIILFSTYRLLSESIKLSLDGVPGNIDVDKVKEVFADNGCICNIHHIHVWAISTTEVAMTAHVVVNDITKMDLVRQDIRMKLKNLGITHCTLEFEQEGYLCHCSECE